MPDELPTTRGDREFQKFTTDAAGNVAVRTSQGVVDDEGHELDIDPTGRAQMYDRTMHNELKNIDETLKEILFELKLMNA